MGRDGSTRGLSPPNERVRLRAYTVQEADCKFPARAEKVSRRTRGNSIRFTSCFAGSSPISSFSRIEYRLISLLSGWEDERRRYLGTGDGESY